MIDELDRTTAVAIVGIAARFPSAHDVVELWRLVRGDLIDEQLRANGVDSTALANANDVKWAGALDGVDGLDATFLVVGLNPFHKVGAN
jgi:acyl transferase domain-containing protein